MPNFRDELHDHKKHEPENSREYMNNEYSSVNFIFNCKSVQQKIQQTTMYIAKKISANNFRTNVKYSVTSLYARRYIPLFLLRGSSC